MGQSVSTMYGANRYEDSIVRRGRDESLKPTESRILNTRISLYGATLSILFFCAACPHFFGYNKPWWLSPALAIALFLVVYLKRHNDKEFIVAQNCAVGAFFASRSLIPFAAATLMTLCLFLLGDTGFTQISRPISIFIQYLCIASMVYALIWEYGSRAIDRLFYILCIICVFQFFCGLVFVGPIQVLAYLSGENSDSGIGRYFELHDICLIMPLIAIYYARIAKDDRWRWMKALVALAISLIGGKRIALAALAVVFLLSLFFKLGKSRRLQIVELIVQVALITAAYLWIFITATDLFAQLCEQFGINSMGRTIIYSYFRQFVDKDILSFGLGSGFCVLQLESLLGTNVLDGVNGVLGVHNDLLKIFIDCGSIGFTAFIVYSVVYFPAALGKRFGGEAKTMYYLAFSYALIIYMTDNATTYIVFQTVYFLTLVPRAFSYANSLGGIRQADDMMPTIPRNIRDFDSK